MASCSLIVRTDRVSACYDVGEPVAFRVEATGDAPSEMTYSLTWDGAALIERGTVRLAGGIGTVTARPDHSGFVRLTVEDEAGAPLAQAAAAVAPEKIGPSLPVPEDFDAFWQEKLAPYCAAPLDGELRFHAERPEGIIHAVRIPALGDEAIYGWLLRPHGPGPFPAVVRYHGAGVYAVPPENGLEWTERGVMVLSINAHPIPNDRPPEYYAALRTGALADYRTRGRARRETLYFVPMFLRATCAAEFVAGLPEWDGMHLIAEGHSQGGGQALAAAALSQKVTALVVSCPTHCDHTGSIVGRPAGWPKIVEVRDGVPNPAHIEAARYIDGVNFAARITCPALVCVCFLDELCPPTGVYAMYNALCGPKAIHHETTTGHVYTDGFKEATFRWVKSLIAGE